LTICLSLRKRFGKLKANSKGFSSVIGTTFMVLVMMFLSTSVFMWTLSQNTLYNEAIREKNQLESDVLSENVQVTNTTYVVNGNDQVQISVDITNPSSLGVQFTTLWVYASNATYTGYNFTKLSNVNVQGGANLPLSFNMIVKGLRLTGAYSFASWLITARGNVVALQKQVSSNIIVAQLAQGIGSLALNFSEFRFFKYATSTRLANYSDGIKSINVPGQGTPIAFGAILTNLDPIEQPITLNQYSNVWLILPGAAGQIVQFFIVNVASDGTITTPYPPITIAFGETKLIVFAALYSNSVLQSSISPSLTPNPGAVNLLLLGTIGPRDYGQNIPFVSVYVYKP